MYIGEYYNIYVLFFRCRCKQENRYPIPTAIKPQISLYSYREIFNTEFNFGFGLPRTDTCARCEALEMELRVCNEDEKDRLLEEQRRHHDKADDGYKSKRLDNEAAKRSWRGKTRTLGRNTTSKDAVDMITFDFQKNLETPNLFHNDVFYLRQLWTYSFGIHDCVATQGYLYLWDETAAKRGSSEVASCLYKFFKDFRSGAR